MTKKLNLVVDTYGCPNRCLHCWLGHFPNRIMEDGADSFIVDYFSPYFDSIAYYSWLREPDYCDSYRERWERDKALSKNAIPERFELASFWRIVRDEEYIPFLRSVGTEKVQLTFFGLEETQDRYVGRPGAFREVIRAGELLVRGGITPRWQCFINEENANEILKLRELAEKIKESECPELEFFVHEGSCEGENRKLYPIRIRKSHIPDSLKDVYLDYGNIKTEAECFKALKNDPSSPVFPVGDEITLNISNTYDVYYNFTHMTPPWRIGNLKTDGPAELSQRVINGNTPALNAAKRCSWADLTGRYGDPSSERVFSTEDFKTYLFNEYLNSLPPEAFYSER